MKHAFLKTGFAFLTAAVVFTAAMQAHAAAPKSASPALPVYKVAKADKEVLSYHIYAGGFEALDASLVMDLTPKAYDMELSAQTKGFIGKMFPWSGNYTTSGHANPGAPPLPLKNVDKSVWRGSLKTTEMEYAPDGHLLKSTQLDKGVTTVTREFAPELTKGAVDILTGTLMMLQSVENHGICEGSFPVFDGKRRFNITLKDDGVDNIAPGRYSIFTGEAIRCILTVEPVAGFRKKDMKRGWMAVQNHTQEYKKPPKIWMARATPGGPIVPVRMEIASAYGGVVAHLAGVK